MSLSWKERSLVSGTESNDEEDVDSGRGSRISSHSANTSARTTSTSSAFLLSPDSRRRRRGLLCPILRSDCSESGSTGGESCCIAGPGLMFRSRIRASAASPCSSSSSSKRRKLSHSSNETSEDFADEGYRYREESLSYGPIGASAAASTAESGSTLPVTGATGVTLRSVYRVTLTGRTADGRVIDRITRFSSRNMSRTPRVSRATAASHNSSKTHPSAVPTLLPYEEVDEYLRNVDNDDDNDDARSVSSIASSASALRNADWTRNASYQTVASNSRSQQRPHTPESAIFTRQQCRNCRSDPNMKCPVHEHLNREPKGSKRTPKSNGTRDGLLDLSDGEDFAFDMKNMNDEEDEENAESGVDIGDDQPLVSPANSRKKKTKTVPNSPPAVSPTYSRKVTITKNSPPAAAATTVPLPQTASVFSDDDDDGTGGETSIRKTIRRHHNVTYTSTNTRRIKPSVAENLIPAAIVNSQIYQSATSGAKRLMDGKRFHALAIVTTLFVAVTAVALLYPRTDLISEPSLLPVSQSSSFSSEEQAAREALVWKQIGILNQAAERLSSQMAEQSSGSQAMAKETQLLKQEVLQLRSGVTRDLDLFRRELELLSVWKNKAGIRIDGWEESLKLLKDEARRLKSTAQPAIRSSGLDISADDLDARIWRHIWSFDADKTGLTDYALESSGASVVSTRCSHTYKPKNKNFAVFGIPILSTSNSPRVVLQPGIEPGNCWAFSGHEGFLVIRLSRKIIPKSFTYEHMQRRISSDPMLSSAPREMTVIGLQDKDSTDGHVLASYEFLVTGQDSDRSLQTFDVQDTDPGAYQFIELRVTSNYGHPDYTCLYRFRVHGREPVYTEQES